MSRFVKKGDIIMDDYGGHREADAGDQWFPRIFFVFIGLCLLSCIASLIINFDKVMDFIKLSLNIFFRIN